MLLKNNLYHFGFVCVHIRTCIIFVPLASSPVAIVFKCVRADGVHTRSKILYVKVQALHLLVHTTD